MISFAGKTAVVTGGGSGIGRAVAELLGELGAKVHVFDLPAVDVTDKEKLAAAFDVVGEVDVVMANAGIGKPASIETTTEEFWQRTIDVNLKGVFLTVQQAVRKMKPRRSGAIVLTASTNSYDGEAELIAYNASKAGVLGILQTAANELGAYGIRVNAVCPGLIRTPLTDWYYDYPEKLKPYFQHIPMGRGGEPREVAQAMAFLASEAASYVTGVALRVDGGQMVSKYSTWEETTAEFARDHWRLRS